jgi:hypothetical protein
MPLNVHPKRYKKIYHHRRSHCKKGYVDKIFADSGCGDTHFLANCGTHAKHMPFNKISEPVHTANLHTFFSINKRFK